jgi:hypothetical protein
MSVMEPGQKTTTAKHFSSYCMTRARQCRICMVRTLWVSQPPCYPDYDLDDVLELSDLLMMFAIYV